MKFIAHAIVAFFLPIVVGCAAPGGKLVGVEPREKVLVNVDDNGVALQGYDPVAYFTDGKPVKGDPAHRSAAGGATYQFATAAHKAMFDADPKKYEPQFGGYCGYAASIDKVSPISVDYWQVLDGRLVLQHNKKAWDLWNKDVPGNLKKADANWSGLVARNGEPARVLVNTDDAGLAIQGYDPVAYFTDGKPVMGSPAFATEYGGARYWFASAAHEEMFKRDPAKFAPRFGGFCGYAASINKVSPIDPAIFQIIDGRLVLQHTEEAYRLFNENAQASLARAETNWPGLVQRNGM